MVDIGRSLRTAVMTGQVKFGFTQSKKAVQAKQAKLVVVARNAPAKIVEELRSAGARIHPFEGNNFDLGAVCGKPFAVSALAVLDPGESDILAVA